jgi:hypothetical protein
MPAEWRRGWGEGMHRRAFPSFTCLPRGSVVSASIPDIGAASALDAWRAKGRGEGPRRGSPPKNAQYERFRLCIETWHGYTNHFVLLNSLAEATRSLDAREEVGKWERRLCKAAGKSIIFQAFHTHGYRNLC